MITQYTAKLGESRAVLLVAENEADYNALCGQYGLDSQKPAEYEASAVQQQTSDDQKTE